MKREEISEELKKKYKLHSSIRKVWIINPKTRCKGNDKVYNRKKDNQKIKKQIREEL
uniref:Uncharacterized protein n=1 Tax=viral metagenome TaxID=1070528 RepID=A0A6M3JU41_9ZZZZ